MVCRNALYAQATNGLVKIDPVSGEVLRRPAEQDHLEKLLTVGEPKLSWHVEAGRENEYHIAASCWRID